MTTPKKGKLIVIEGIDGSGKETQTTLLVDWIRQHQHQTVTTFDFPSYDDRSLFGCIIGRYLKGEFGNPVTIDPFETALLYAGDRMHARSKIQNALNRGDVVLLNRYVPSNLAYGQAKLCILNRHNECDALFDFTEGLEYDLAGLPRPDAVIVLDVLPKVATTLVDSKTPRSYLDGEDRDRYEADTVLQQLVRQQYLTLGQCMKGWHIVNCISTDTMDMRSIETVQEDIRNIVKETML